MIRPAKGFAPSLPVKVCTTVSWQDGYNLNTIPLPKEPPNADVPYRLPAVSMIKGASGPAPSFPPAKLYRTVSLPEASSLNTVPQPAKPGRAVQARDPPA